MAQELAAPPRVSGDAIERDRKSGIETGLQLARWIVIVFAAIGANIPLGSTPNELTIDRTLALWALINAGNTYVLLKRELTATPTVGAAMTLVDLLAAALVVSQSGGTDSNLAFVLFMPVVAATVRYGATVGLIVTIAVVGADLIASATSVSSLSDKFWQTIVARTFSELAVWGVTALVARELISSRARQLKHSFALEHAASNELQQVERIKSDFMMLASHELRTPLTKIKAWLTLMQEAGGRLPQESMDEGIAELRTESEHLARLTDNLLCIAQLESGEIRLRSETVHLDVLLKEVLGRFLETADPKRFSVELDADARGIIADEERTALVLTCLIENALKFSPEEEQVHIAAHRVVTRIHIEVQDFGRRIPDSELDRVFASFYQVETPLIRQRGGFGVGLYLARQLTERMGGKIWIDNRRSRGNTFIVALPVHL